MSGLGVAGLGAGALRGLDRFRRYEREDADEKRRESGEVRAEQTHGLSMRTGEQGYSQREQLFPEQLKVLQQSNSYNEQANPFRIDALGLSNDQARENLDYTKQANPERIQALKTGNEQADLALDFSKKTMPAKLREVSRADAAGERASFEAQLENDFQDMVFALHQGDMNSINTYNAKVADALQKPINFTVLPSGKPGMVTVRNVNDEEGKSDKEVSLKELVQGGTPKRLMASLNAQQTNGTLKPADWNSLDARNSRFFGSLDKQGQVFLSGDAKFQKDETNKRTMEMINAGVPAWQAEITARASVGGSASGDKVKLAAEDAATEAGINPDNENYDSFINTYMQTNDATGQQQAEANYRKIMSVESSSVGLSSATVKGQQQPAQMPTVGSDAEYDALPAGATFINSADGKTYKKN